MSRRSNLSYDDGMMLWKSRDAYRVHTALLALFYLPQVLMLPFLIDALLRGLWAHAATRAMAIALLWVARWVLCTGLPRLVRWGWHACRSRMGVVGLLWVWALG